MTEPREEPEQEDNEQPQQLDEGTKDALKPEYYDFTDSTSQHNAIELAERNPPSGNGDDGDGEGGDTSDDSLEPEYVEKGDDEAESIERR